jgi:hypothetical protein
MALASLIPFAVNLGASLLGGGPDAQPGTLGEPSSSQVMAMLQRATLEERSKLSSLWAAIDGRGPLFTDRNMSVLSVAPDYFAFHAWGGSDGQVTSSTGKALKAYLVQLLSKYAGNAAATNPAFIPEQYQVPGVDYAPVATGGVNVTGHIDSDGRWRVDLGGAAGDPGYVQAAAPGAWLLPLMLAGAAVVLVLILRK